MAEHTLKVKVDLDTAKCQEKLTKLLQEFEQLVPSAVSTISTNAKRVLVNDIGSLGYLSGQELDSMTEHIVQGSLDLIEKNLGLIIGECLVFNQDS